MNFSEQSVKHSALERLKSLRWTECVIWVNNPHCDNWYQIDFVWIIHLVLCRVLYSDLSIYSWGVNLSEMPLQQNRFDTNHSIEEYEAMDWLYVKLNCISGHVFQHYFRGLSSKWTPPLGRKPDEILGIFNGISVFSFGSNEKFSNKQYKMALSSMSAKREPETNSTWKYSDKKVRK